VAAAATLSAAAAFDEYDWTRVIGSLDNYRHAADEVQLPTLNAEADFCSLRIETQCGDGKLAKALADWHDVSLDGHAVGSWVQCHVLRQEAAKRCGEGAEVAMRYRGLLMATEPRDDGSWVVVGRDRRGVAAVRPLGDDFRRHHRCFEAKTFGKRSSDEALKPFDEGAAEATYQFCLPVLVITGHFKAGTSALYNILISHPKLIGGKPKELCIGRDEPGPIGSYIKILAKRTKTMQEDDLLVNACLGVHEYELLNVLFRGPPMLKLFLTRDAPITIWSAWNYFCMPEIESACSPVTTKVGVHYRSPELFHELYMMAKQKISRARVPFRIPRDKDLATYFMRKIESIQTVSPGEDDWLYLANEMIAADIDTFWDRIASKIRQHFGISLEKTEGLEQITHVRVNSNDSKGKKTAVESHSEGEYQITNYRAMLNEDVAAIKKAWAECSKISEMTAWDYQCVGGTR